MFDFKIAETKTFKKLKENLDEKLYNKVKNVVYPQLRSNPYFGANIKKLKGEFEGTYGFRVGNYRLFYLVDSQEMLVFILECKHRQGAYNN